jgi:hypothetical protein
MPNYPDGKLNDEDEGEIPIMMGVENGCVILRFPEPTMWIGFPPEMARALAEGLIQYADTLDGNKMIPH